MQPHVLLPHLLKGRWTSKAPRGCHKKLSSKGGGMGARAAVGAARRLVECPMMRLVLTSYKAYNGLYRKNMLDWALVEGVDSVT